MRTMPELSSWSTIFTAMQRVNPLPRSSVQIGSAIPGMMTDRATSVLDAYQWIGPLPRRYPQEGLRDTILFDYGARLTHAVNYFSDDDIEAVILHPDQFDRVYEYDFSDYATATPLPTVDVRFGMAPFGRFVLQQGGRRGCVAACGAMICLDHRILPNWHWLLHCNVSDEDQLKTMLSRKGIESTVEHMDPLRLGERLLGERLENLLRHHYSGALKINGHFIILDYFSRELDRAIIRDPFHGWCIATTTQALLRSHPTFFLGVVQQ